MQALIAPELEDYARAHSRAETPLLRELADYTRAHCAADAEMLIGPLEGALLHMLVRLLDPRRIVEIGTFTGYSALTLADAAAADAKIVSCDIDASRQAIAQSFIARSGHRHKIQLLLGPALETLPTLAGPFDLVFIDADKENYYRYYELMLPKLRPGGLIVADNVLWSGRVLSPQAASDRAIVEFNRRVAADPRVELALLTVRDGVLVARKLP